MTNQIDDQARRNSDADDDGDDAEADDADEPKTLADRLAARGKGKKDHGAFVMIPLMLASIVVPMAYGALAALAGKALIVSKLALVLASIIGIKKLLSKGGHSHDSMSHDVIVSAGGPHDRQSWHRRRAMRLPFERSAAAAATPVTTSMKDE